MSAIALVEDEVRELVRRRGLDPATDSTAVRHLIDEVVTQYDERTLTSKLPPLVDSRLAARQVYDAVAGFGALQRYLRLSDCRGDLGKVAADSRIRSRQLPGGGRLQRALERLGHRPLRRHVGVEAAEVPALVDISAQSVRHSLTPRPSARTDARQP